MTFVLIGAVTGALAGYKIKPTKEGILFGILLGLIFGVVLGIGVEMAVSLIDKAMPAADLSVEVFCDGVIADTLNQM